MIRRDSRDHSSTAFGRFLDYAPFLAGGTFAVSLVVIIARQPVPGSEDPIAETFLWLAIWSLPAAVIGIMINVVRGFWTYGGRANWDPVQMQRSAVRRALEDVGYGGGPDPAALEETVRRVVREEMAARGAAGSGAAGDGDDLEERVRRAAREETVTRRRA